MVPQTAPAPAAAAPEPTQPVAVAKEAAQTPQTAPNLDDSLTYAVFEVRGGGEEGWTGLVERFFLGFESRTGRFLTFT